ncbi:MAG: hypothetical protein H3C36_14415 [Chitinophagaceae bacterium]|nr:hypothetical protein [Chitinophagaceae bacterium]MCO5286002.1 hypothetical protein [Chitinophagaceae bacterium]
MTPKKFNKLQKEVRLAFIYATIGDAKLQIANDLFVDGIQIFFQAKHGVISDAVAYPLPAEMIALFQGVGKMRYMLFVHDDEDTKNKIVFRDRHN